MAYLDQAPGLEPPAPMQPAPQPAVGAVGATTMTPLLVVGAVVVAGYLAWRSMQEEDEEEEAPEGGGGDDRATVELYSLEDRTSDGWEPRKEVVFRTRELADDYADQQADFYDKIVVISEEE